MAGLVNSILMHGHQLAGPFLDAVDLLGTFVFALSGAAAGVKSRFDLFGLMALSFAAGNAGGITRDVLIGAVPPAAISDWRYLGVSLLAGLVTFFWYPDIDKRRRLVLLFDAAGLGLFAVAGTQKALIAGLNPVMAIFMGVLTGIGGGILRDVLVNQTPTVLRGGYLCCCCASRWRRSSDRICFALPGFSDDDRGRTPLLLAASYGDIPRMAFAQTRVLGPYRSPQSDAHHLLISPRLRASGRDKSVSSHVRQIAVNDAIFHHEIDICRGRDVRKRITGHCHYIGEFAGCERSKIIAP